jgi:hypothetical protein
MTCTLCAAPRVVSSQPRPTRRDLDDAPAPVDVVTSSRCPGAQSPIDVDQLAAIDVTASVPPS